MPTFGTNTRQRVPVVQKMMKTDMMMKLAFWSSFNTKLNTYKHNGYQPDFMINLGGFVVAGFC